VKPRLPLLLGPGLSLFLVASVAFADDAPPPAPSSAPAPAPPPGEEWTANAAQQRIGLEWDVFPTENVFVMAWDVGAHIRVAKEVFQPGDSILVGARYAWSYYNASQNGFTIDQAAYGNPSVGARYTLPLDSVVPDLRVHGGFYFTAPVLAEPDQVVGIVAAVSSVTRAYFDAERLLPGAMTFRINLGAEYRILPNLYYRGDLNPVIWVPTGGGDAEFVLEQGNEIEYRFDFGLGAGLRFQEAFLLTNNDLAQLAMEPFVAYTPKGAGFYGRLGLLVALDDPLGFGFDRGKLATIRISGGYQLE
jgi:hypothetical protein